MDKVQYVMARLGCARLLLARAKGNMEHPIVSRVQMDAVIASMEPKLMAGMAPDHRAMLLALLTRCEFLQEHLQKLLVLVEPPAATPAKIVPSKRPMQVFVPNILHYFTDAEWARMTGNVHDARDLLIVRILDLGGINISEKCKASLVSLLLYLFGMRTLDEATKKSLLEQFKAEHKKRARQHREVNPYLLHLPMPSHLKSQSPELYHSVFGGQDPTPSQINYGSVAMPTVFCRSTSKVSAQLLQLEARFQPHGGGQLQPGGAPLQLLERVVALQQSSMEIMRAGGQSAQLPQAAQALRALTAPAPQPFQGSLHGRLALPPAYLVPGGLGTSASSGEFMPALLDQDPPGMPQSQVAVGPLKAEQDDLPPVLQQPMAAATPPSGKELASSLPGMQQADVSANLHAAHRRTMASSPLRMSPLRKQLAKHNQQAEQAITEAAQPL